MCTSDALDYVASSLSNITSLSFASILFTRFVLKLRAAENTGIDPDKSLHYSSIDLSVNLTGNLGAPLEHSISGSDDHPGQITTSIRQQLENPLAIGILDVDPVQQGQR